MRGTILVVALFAAANLFAQDSPPKNVEYLSDLKPKKTSVAPIIANYTNPPLGPQALLYYRVKKDKNYSGSHLQLGGTIYKRGLCIHSKTELEYELQEDVRRFRAVVGIDDSVAKHGLGDVKLTIKGDGEKLFQKSIRAKDKPRDLDLDVSQVKRLEIIVDGFRDDDLGFSDHLTLGDAKFIK